MFGCCGTSLVWSRPEVVLTMALNGKGLISIIELVNNDTSMRDELTVITSFHYRSTLDALRPSKSCGGSVTSYDYEHDHQRVLNP